MKPAKKFTPAEVHSLRIPAPLLERIMKRVRLTGKTKSDIMLGALERGLKGVK